MMRNAISQGLWTTFGHLPIRKRKVLFSSYYGRGYSDSPKAIAQALLDSGEEVELFWLVKSPQEAATLPQGITPVNQNNPVARIYAYATSRVWVDNCRKYVPTKRKGQFYLQTWHGFALKMVEADALQALEPAYVEGAKADGAMTDLMISGSRFMTDLYRRAFWYSGAVEELGTPRNDMFFQRETYTRSVRQAFGLEPNRKLVLYAPTFRASHSLQVYALDAQALAQACQTRFGGDWTVLIRLHPNVASGSKELFAYDGQTLVDATGYPDMQELLAGVDLLVTDYSSSMFDFALTGKPCVLYALDVEDYARERNFYFPLESLPFPMARRAQDLETVILNYEESVWAEKWNRFSRQAGFVEDGLGAKRCAQWILERLG